MDSLPLFIKIYFKLFQLLGYLTIPLNKVEKPLTLKTQILRSIWPTIIFSMSAIAVSFVFFDNDEFLFKLDAFGYFNDLLKFIFAQIAITTFYWESMQKVQNQQKFWQIWLQLQKQKPHYNYKTSVLKRIWAQIRHNAIFLGIFFFITLLELTVLILFVLCENFTRHLILFWCLFVPYGLIVHFKNIQFIFHLELIRHELEQLKTDLGLLADYTRFLTKVRPFKGFEQFLRLKILQKQQNYQQIFEMFTAFHTAFSFSIIAFFMMIYVRVLADVYFMYYSIYTNRNRFEILLLIPSVFEIPAFLIISMKCMNVVKHISFELHSIISPLDETTISVQIQNFSLQMLHQKIVVNGVGISTMDGYMLSRAIGSITMNMIFFIQFMPKFKYN